VSLGGIGNLDYTILLCSKMDETRAFYRDVMKFPIETELENWVSFRVGAALLTLRRRGRWSVCDDGKSVAGSAAVQLAQAHFVRILPPGPTARRSALLGTQQTRAEQRWRQRRFSVDFSWSSSQTSAVSSSSSGRAAHPALRFAASYEAWAT